MNKKIITIILLLVGSLLQTEQIKLNLVEGRIEIATRELCNEKDIQKLFNNEIFSNNTFKVNLDNSFSYSQSLYGYPVYAE